MKTETNTGASQQKSISFCWSWTVAKPHHAGEAFENRVKNGTENRLHGCVTQTMSARNF